MTALVAALAILLPAASAQDPAPETPDPAALPLPEPDPRVKLPRAERFRTNAFRATIAAGPPSVSTRVALVEDFDGPFIGEVTLRGQVGWHVFAMAVEVAGTAGASPYWSGAGLGNTVLDLRLLVGRGSTHAIGLRGTFPTGERSGAHGPVGWWGTVPAATVPTFGVALAYDGATPNWVWHLHAGFRTDPFWGYAYVGGIFDVGGIVATVQPLAERWDIVVEVEALLAPTPVHIRGLARHEFGGGWVTDAGVAVPVPAIVTDPTLQVIGRLERRW